MVRVIGKLIVEVYDRFGRLKVRHEQPANLTLDNYIRFMQVLLESVAQGADKSVSGFKDTTGLDCLLRIGNANSCWDYAYYGAFDRYVCIGTGTTAPSNSDYKLESEIGCAGAGITNETFTDTEMSFEVTGVIDITQDTTVNEVGCKIRCTAECYDPTIGDFVAGEYDFLVFRDVLSTPISVKAGDKVRVVYKITITR